MAQQRLLTFLEKLDNELKLTSAKYRTGVGNFLIHDFSIYPFSMIEALKQGILSAINIPKKQRGTLYNDNEKFIKDQVEAFFKQVKENIKKKKQTKKWQDSISIKIDTSKLFLVTLKQPEQDKKQNIYAVIYGIYEKDLNTMYGNILKKLNLESLSRQSRTKGSKAQRHVSKGTDFFNLGHVGDNTNASQQINNAVYDTVKELAANPPELSAQLSSLPGIKRNFLIFKDSRSGKATVTIQSKYNNTTDSIQEKKWAQDVKIHLKKAINILKTDIVNLSGSDSLLEGYRKNAGAKIVSSFKKSKVLKVVSEDFKHKKPNTSASLDISPTFKRAKKQKTKSTGIRKRRVAGSRRVSKGVSSNPLQLIGIINQKLPETVRKNMGVPGLENQTGQFASSVRLTDVVQTPQGFPSFGYTYQKDPYQVFEVGAGSPPWATGARDPRTVIDRSIREIAAQFAIGRFYTRRE